MNANQVRLVAIACAAIGCSVFQGCEFFDKDKTTLPPPPPTTIIETEEIIVEPPALPPPIIEEVKPVSLIPVRPEVRYYTIAKGDTLSEVARREGVRVQDVKALNAGIDPNKLSIGQSIVLPGKGATVESIGPRPTTGTTKSTEIKPLPPPNATLGKDGKSVTYTVAAGDSLSVIAHRFGAKVEDIRAANKLKNDMIRVGQKITIPSPTKSYTAPNGATETVKSGAKSGSKTVDSTKTATTVKVDPPKGTGSGTTTTVPPPPPVVPDPVDTTILIPAAPTGPTVPVLTPVGGTTESTQKFTTYTVKEGEDVVSIALRWGVGFMELKALNNLTESKVPAGTTLKIPIAD